MHLLTRVGVLLLTLAAAAAAQVRDASAETKWRPLFNGKDLSGWTPKIKGYALGDNHADTFRVEGGILEVRYDGYEEFGGRFGHLFYERPFSSYRLRVEYRFVGEQCPGGPGWAFRNSGVMLHGQSAASMGRDQEFPVSIEVQLLGGRAAGERPTANLCTPGTHVVLNGELCKRHCKRTLTVHLNGAIVNEIDLDRPELAKRPARGAIGFQDHGLPLALRRIRVRTPR